MASVVIIMIFGIQLYLTLYGIDSSIVFRHACLFHSLKNAKNHSLICSLDHCFSFIYAFT